MKVPVQSSASSGKPYVEADSENGGIEEIIPVSLSTRSLRSTLVACFGTVVCTVLGTGMLGTPQVLMQSGWVMGSLLIVFFAAAASYAIYGLCKACVDIKESKGDDWLCSYPNVARHALGTVGEWLVIINQNLTLVMVSTMFIVLGGGSLASLFEENGLDILGADDKEDAIKVWMCIFFAFAAPPVIFFRGMKDLAFVAIYGASASVVVAFLVVISATTQPPGPNEDTSTNMAPISFEAFLLSLGTVVFSYGAATEAPLLVAEAPKKARPFVPHMAAAGLAFAACMYLMVAWAGYAIYGNALGAEGIDGNVLNRLSYGVPKIVAQALITTHVFSAFGVLIQPVLVQLERALGLPDPYSTHSIATAVKDQGEGGTGGVVKEQEEVGSNELVVGSLNWKQKLLSITARFLVCAFALFLAELIPFFGDLLTLIGSVTATSSCFTLPFFVYLFHFYKRMHWAERGLLCVLILCCILATIGGTVTSVQQIVKDSSNFKVF